MHTCAHVGPFNPRLRKAAELRISSGVEIRAQRFTVVMMEARWHEHAGAQQQQQRRPNTRTVVVEIVLLPHHTCIIQHQPWLLVFQRGGCAERVRW